MSEGAISYANGAQRIKAVPSQHSTYLIPTQIRWGPPVNILMSDDPDQFIFYLLQTKQGADIGVS